MIEWHRLFGLGVIDYFTDSGYEVMLEKDLSIKQRELPCRTQWKITREKSKKKYWRQ